jgi:ABC-type antimicrobial peptide transport system permease subunit
MLKSFFVISFRNILHYRSFSIMNVAGLTLGISCALFIFLLVEFEKSYDTYHAKADRIYRINGGAPNTADDEFDTGTPSRLAPILREEFPEIELTSTVLKTNPENSQVKFNSELTRVKGLYYASPETFQLLDFVWINGSPQKSLRAAGQAVVTESVARRYFNDGAMGKIIQINGATDVQISGIIKDPPINSDFPFEVVVSHATFEKEPQFINADLQGWNSSYQTYVLLRDGKDPAVINAKLTALIAKRLGKDIAEKSLSFRLMPLSDIHFVLGNFNDRIISTTTLNTLSLIGVFIVLIACINFANLAGAQAIRRSREVGIRKTLGSSRKSLILQFLGETFVVTLAAVTLSFVVVSQLILMSEYLTEIPLTQERLTQPSSLLFLLSVLIGVTILSGFYPAFVMSGFRPAEALKSGKASPGAGGLYVRKGLTAFQFVITQVLLICTMIVIRQIDHFNELPLGFNKDAVLTADIPDATPAILSTLKNNLLRYPEIKNVSYSLNTPSATINKYWAGFLHRSFPDRKSAELKFADSTYFAMFELQLIAGTRVIPNDSGRTVIINEDLLHTIGIQDPNEALGEKINYWGTDAVIIGVMRDFQTVSLAEGMHPVLLANHPAMFKKVSIKIDLAHASSAIEKLEHHWKESFNDYYFTYSFLDNDIATFYKEERRISKLLIAFAIVAMLIGCIGLFGLIMFTSIQRTKEIGIRKILGATVANISALLSREFIALVAIAGIIGSPIAYYFMTGWLSGFKNQISLIENSWVFVAAIVVALSFAFVTVSIQALQAARRNPTESLRSD